MTAPTLSAMADLAAKHNAEWKLRRERGLWIATLTGPAGSIAFASYSATTAVGLVLRTIERTGTLAQGAA